MESAEPAPVDIGEEYRLLIGGEWVTPDAGTYPIVDPNTTGVIGHAPEASASQVADAAAAARAALPGWRAMPMADRCALLGRAADLLDERIGSLAGLVQGETGATVNVTESMQLPSCGERFRQYQTPVNLDETLAPYPVEANPLGPGGLAGAHVIRQPVGVVACITSYNFPLVNVAGKVAPALAMGNTVVIKPAPQDPLAMIKAVGIIEEAGFPPGVINIVTGPGAGTGAALVESRDVDMVSFTGSSAVGVKIMEAGAATMKRLLMELGGKGACVLTEDCDVDAAIGAIATVWGFHSGQICTAPTRVIVHRSRHDELVDKLTAVAGMLKVGDARDRGTVVGPVITEAHRDRVEGYIAGGRAEGATVLAGGERPDRPGCFVAPTLLVDCTPGMRVVREEIFGPVVVVLAHDGDDHAVELANSSDYGLFSYVFAGDTARAFEIGRRIESGNVGLNSLAPHTHAPFGGFKMSGIGRDRGVYGLHAYSEMQALSWLSR
ncbi:aldehyde dehydrogenase family protein [Candidatus Poriferisocius sp.]|uniref:aldehyde dehydrogenase family protein n=1 Tax=Candidatus Poriferisocius sp. TaxID=3101276 RepID=UPI003B01A21B